MNKKRLTYKPIDGTLALVDGDILTYRIGFSTQDVNDEITLSRINTYIDNILFESGASDYIIYLSPDKNYRNTLYPDYKANRTQERPKHYELIRGYLLAVENAVICDNEEADDAMGIAQMKGYNEEEDVYTTIICTIDKDLNQIPGRHFDFVKNKAFYITPEEGIYFFYMQLLQGDRVDNIPGLPKVGPVKAAKILGEISDESTYKEKVLSAYQQYLSLDEAAARERINLIGKLLYIRKKELEIWEF